MDTKYDFLVTEISDKIIQCYELLKKDNKIPNNMKLREFYNKYLHPEVLDTSNPLIWQHLAAGDILDVFQFNTGVGLAIAKKLKPKTPQEMTSANAMMRLMSEKGKESQQDRYVRIQKQGLHVFEQEMINAEMDDSIRAIMHEYCDEYWGCCAIQEQTMSLLMKVCGFTLGEANSARKIIAKKQMSKIPELKEKVFSCFREQKAANYFWENIVSPQLGYAFSFNHSLPYSFVGIQTIYLAINWSPVYWNCACLIVNSGSLESRTEEEIVNIYEKEDDPDAEYIDLPDRSGKIKKTNSTDYSKLARAIGEIRQAGVKLSLVDINESSFGFKPDAENNRILFGLKGLAKVGDDVIARIIENRPYVSVKDFYRRVKPTKPQMLSLIKGGAFDQMEERKRVMAWYIWEICDKKTNLTLQNMASFIKYNMLPQGDEFTLALRVYNFNKYLKLHKNSNGSYYTDERSLNFLAEIGKEEVIEDNCIKPKVWDKVYQKYMDTFRNWIAADKQNLLFTLNGKIFKELWDSCASGNYSTWEMEVMCFYYHEHELAHLNNNKYGYANFFVLPEEPIIERTFPKGNSIIKLYKLSKICGTCIAKNKDKSTVVLLTTSGVVTVKFNKEFFAMYDKRISEKGADGKGHIIEGSWFDKGSMIVVNGVRIDDTFICKKYSSTPGHRLMKITSIDENGNITLQGERYNGILED